MGRFATGIALGLLAALAAPAPAVAAGSLHRPLELPELAPGAECPVSPIGEGVDWESTGIFGGSGTGPGPVYPGLGSEGGNAVADDERLGRRYGAKVFWYVEPAYQGPVLIRGARIDGPGGLRFSGPGRRQSVLRIRRNGGTEWSGQPPGSRGQPSGVLFRAPGCYAVQIDGTTFSRDVVFTTSVKSF
jgi:hypothetical protein